MRNFRRLTVAILLIFVVIIITMSVNCSNQPSLLKGTGEPVNLINNNAARDHPWQEVSKFLSRDNTDEEEYTIEHDSNYFAELLHNRAEYYGFRTAFVVVEFENGETYSLNAFNTVDYGTIYIDCMGSGNWERNPMPDIELDYRIDNLGGTSWDNILFLCKEYGITDYAKGIPEFPCNVTEFPWELTSWDKVAYVVEGEKLCFLNIDCEGLEFNYNWYRKSRESAIDIIEDIEWSWNRLNEMVDNHHDRFTVWFEANDGDKISYSEWTSLVKQGMLDDVEEIEFILELERPYVEVEIAHTLSWFIEPYVSQCMPYQWNESDTTVVSIQSYW